MRDPLVYVQNPDRPEGFILGAMRQYDRDTGTAIVDVGGIAISYSLAKTFLRLDSEGAELDAVFAALGDPAKNLAA